jgi:hypothetical protein
MYSTPFETDSATIYWGKGIALFTTLSMLLDFSASAQFFQTLECGGQV